MSDLSNLNLKALHEIAKSLNIVGRHMLPKNDLVIAIQREQTVQHGVDHAYVFTKPYTTRHYGAVTKNEKVYATLPKQAKQIFDFLASTGFKGTGNNIVNAAVEKGFLKTTQKGDVLFAFYARKLETAGVRLVG